ncbi:hypothetical protein [Polaromonas naphthalenivorans]|uniref:Uncharacterized protein n=1 Tax=Polaromonas naphthalenivorans (strain CJ2) TaxID=365044 RepID=A1VSG5_POLNA|nr:hypothetical protein [Polaromonas naphthalenivorans]ABM38593.1 hypothetical protein Pnap_3295 [Polaromonas naphthalenivorans CJ2]
MNDHQTLRDVLVETAKASPPVAVVTAGLASGWTLNNALTALTILYVVLQIAWLLWRWHRAVRLGLDPEGDAS